MESLAERFVIESRVGTGGTAEVFRGVDLRTKRVVAIKRIRSDYSDRVARARFEREARILAGLDVPHVVGYVAHGHDAQRRFCLVTEWLEGETVEQLLARGLPGDWTALQILYEAALGLTALHEVGVIHRDVKPGNLFLATAEGGALVKIIDLGIALADGDLSLTAHNTVVGSPVYISPEQLRGEEPTPSSDLYALAVVFYELLTGRRPFSGKNTVAILRSVLTDPHPPLRQLRPDLPPSLDALLDRCLSKDPADRPATALEFADEVAAILHAVATHPDGVSTAALRARRAQRARVVVVAQSAHAGRRAKLRAALEEAGARVDDRDDGCVAAFGDLRWRGDEPARAVRTALALRARGVKLAVAAGLGVRVDGRLSGDAVDRAGELATHSADNELRVDDATSVMVGDAFETVQVDVGVRVVRDLAATPWIVAPSRLGPRDAPPGRAEEQQRLRAEFESAWRVPRCHVAVVWGEAGVGKSWLTRALLSALSTRAEVSLGGAFLTVRGDAHESASPLAAVERLVDRGGDSGDTLTESLTSLLRAACEVSPRVVFVENLHWVDEESLEVLARVFRRLRDMPLAVLATGRPERAGTREVHATWRDVIDTEVTLGPLPASVCQALVADVLGDDDPALRRRIVARAEGNSRVLEELVTAVQRHRRAGRAPTVELPVTAQCLVQQTLDDLDAETRRMLRLASVFGRSFWHRGIQELSGPTPRAVVDHALRALEAHGLVAPRPSSRVPGTVEYVFRHALTRDVAYATLLDEDRAALHGHTAVWLGGAGLDEPAQVARHFDRAQLPESAGRWWMRAARRSMAEQMLTAAREQCTKALERTSDLAAQRTLWTLRATAWLASAELTLADEDLSRVEALSPGSVDDRFLLYRCRGERLHLAGRTAEALPWLERARDLDGLGWPAWLDVRAHLAARTLDLGRARDALSLLHDALETPGLPTDAVQSQQARIDLLVARAAMSFDDLAEAEARSQRARWSADERGDVLDGLEAAVALAQALTRRGDAEAARRLLEDVMAHSARTGFRAQELAAQLQLGVSLGCAGALAEALHALDGCVDAASEHGMRDLATRAALMRAWVRSLGAAVDVQERTMLALESDTPPETPSLRCLFYTVRGLLRLRFRSGAEALDDTSAATALWEDGVTMEEGATLLHRAHIDALLRGGADAHEVDARLTAAWQTVLDQADQLTDARQRSRLLMLVPTHRQLADLVRGRGLHLPLM